MSKDNDVENLVSKIKEANLAYRNGQPIMSDEKYDYLLEQLESISPDHPIFLKIDDDPLKGDSEHPVMRSIRKVKNVVDVSLWLKNVIKHGCEGTRIRATPKLDGYAAYKTPDKLMLRGDGVKGCDISRLLTYPKVFDLDDFEGVSIPAIEGNDKELRIIAEKAGVKYSEGDLAGELVIKTNIKGHKCHYRYLLATIMSIGEPGYIPLQNDQQYDIANSVLTELDVVKFVPFKYLPGKVYTVTELVKLVETGAFDNEMRIIRNLTPEYPTDGVVLEVEDLTIRELMGCNARYDRWRVAWKENKDGVTTTVINISYRIGKKSGKEVAVLEVQPITVNGVTIRSVNGFNRSYILKNGIGIGATIEVGLAGDIIPSIFTVITKSTVLSLDDKTL